MASVAVSDRRRGTAAGITSSGQPARVPPSRRAAAAPDGTGRQRPHKSTSELLLGLPPAEPLNICTDEHYCFPSSHPALAISGALCAAKTQDRQHSRRYIGKTIHSDTALQSLNCTAMSRTKIHRRKSLGQLSHPRIDTPAF